jgi:hypothetical protein
MVQPSLLRKKELPTIAPEGGTKVRLPGKEEMPSGPTAVKRTTSHCKNKENPL